MSNVLLVNSNALNIPLADCSVQMVATSPPYYGLRDYGTAKWDGGDAGCDHIAGEIRTRMGLEKWSAEYGSGGAHAIPEKLQFKDICGKCGAIRIDKQIGLEPTPEEYVANLVSVFREVRRVLRDDGVVFLNLGDSYASGKGTCFNPGGGENSLGQARKEAGAHPLDRGSITELRQSGLKPKDLIGIPWRVAFALQADGWWLRSDIIWSKPNPMPESVTDRPTKAHEYVFLLTKSARYYWDADAIREPQSDATIKRDKTPRGRRQNGGGSFESLTGVEYTTDLGDMKSNSAGRNIRTVWHIATAPYKGAHFATWPPKLVDPMIKAGSSEKGCCPACGKPWVRVIEKGYRAPAQEDVIAEMVAKGVPRQKANLYGNPTRDPKLYAANPDKTTGWRASCDCPEHEPIPCVVLDPFAGSGTTLLVARQLGRSGIGLDLSFTYLKENATKRLELDKLRAWIG